MLLCGSSCDQSETLNHICATHLGRPTVLRLLLRFDISLFAPAISFRTMCKVQVSSTPIKGSRHQVACGL